MASAETKVCQNCKTLFSIDASDFDFYKKIEVPHPTLCPSCRLQRRLIWFEGLHLYRRKCDLCHKEKISMYPPGAPYTVYCPECWWSDLWDPLSYGREYDLSRGFFEQFNEHLHSVPLMGLTINKATSELSPYTNHTDHSKNCYLIFYSDYNDDVHHGFYLAHSQSLLDCSIYWESEQCYDSMNGYQNHRVHGSRGNIHSSMDCYFVKDSKNIQYCFGSCNLRNKKYVWFNEQLTKAEYEKRLSEIDLGSYATYQQMRQKAEEVWRNAIPHPAYDYMFNENCTGSYIFYSKNCKECYDSGWCENCKYVLLLKSAKTKDSYDYTDWGENAERIYEGVTVGNSVSDVRFSQDIHASHHVEYSKSCMSSDNLLGCSAVRSKQYCILNKLYSKEEYIALRERIVENMKQRGEYGEFFPMTLSPHAYNDTFAQFFFPLTKAQAHTRGLGWAEPSMGEQHATKQHTDLPDNIRDVSDQILQEVIQCQTCPRRYRITQAELQFLRTHHFPLPRRCPFCRIEEKVRQWVKQMTLIDRTCEECKKQFRTPYTPEDAPRVYCKECYFAKIL